jgi:dihydroorotase
MPNTSPVNDNAGVTGYILRKAADARLARVYPIGAVSRGQLGEQLADIAELREAGCVAITDDGRPVATALLMRRALEYAGMFDMTVIGHCEADPQGRRRRARRIPGVDARTARHSRAMESIMALRDILRCGLTGGAVHRA